MTKEDDEERLIMKEDEEGRQLMKEDETVGWTPDFVFRPAQEK
jgi:hypothetical protein